MCVFPKNYAKFSEKFTYNLHVRELVLFEYFRLHTCGVAYGAVTSPFGTNFFFLFLNIGDSTAYLPQILFPVCTIYALVALSTMHP